MRKTISFMIGILMIMTGAFALVIEEAKDSGFDPVEEIYVSEKITLTDIKEKVVFVYTDNTHSGDIFLLLDLLRFHGFLAMDEFDREIVESIRSTYTIPFSQITDTTLKEKFVVIAYKGAFIILADNELYEENIELVYYLERIILDNQLPAHGEFPVWVNSYDLSILNLVFDSIDSADIFKEILRNNVIFGIDESVVLEETYYAFISFYEHLYNYFDVELTERTIYHFDQITQEMLEENIIIGLVNGGVIVHMHENILHKLGEESSYHYSMMSTMAIEISSIAVELDLPRFFQRPLDVSLHTINELVNYYNDKTLYPKRIYRSIIDNKVLFFVDDNYMQSDLYMLGDLRQHLAYEFMSNDAPPIGSVQYLSELTNEMVKNNIIIVAYHGGFIMYLNTAHAYYDDNRIYKLSLIIQDIIKNNYPHYGNFPLWIGDDNAHGIKQHLESIDRIIKIAPPANGTGVGTTFSYNYQIQKGWNMIPYGVGFSISVDNYSNIIGAYVYNSLTQEYVDVFGGDELGIGIQHTSLWIYSKQQMNGMIEVQTNSIEQFISENPLIFRKGWNFFIEFPLLDRYRQRFLDIDQYSLTSVAYKWNARTQSWMSKPAADLGNSMIFWRHPDGYSEIYMDRLWEPILLHFTKDTVARVVDTKEIIIPEFPEIPKEPTVPQPIELVQVKLGEPILMPEAFTKIGLYTAFEMDEKSRFVDFYLKANAEDVLFSYDVINARGLQSRYIATNKDEYYLLPDLHRKTLTILNEQYDILHAAIHKEDVVLTLLGGVKRGNIFEGETIFFDVNGKTYELTFLNVFESSSNDISAVIMKINGRILHKLRVGESYTYEDGVSIGIYDIVLSENSENMVSFGFGQKVEFNKFGMSNMVRISESFVLDAEISIQGKTVGDSIFEITDMIYTAYARPDFGSNIYVPIEDSIRNHLNDERVMLNDKWDIVHQHPIYPSFSGFHFLPPIHNELLNETRMQLMWYSDGEETTQERHVLVLPINSDEASLFTYDENDIIQQDDFSITLDSGVTIDFMVNQNTVKGLIHYKSRDHAKIVFSIENGNTTITDYQLYDALIPFTNQHNSRALVTRNNYGTHMYVNFFEEAGTVRRLGVDIPHEQLFASIELRGIAFTT